MDEDRVLDLVAIATGARVRITHLILRVQDRFGAWLEREEAGACADTVDEEFRDVTVGEQQSIPDHETGASKDHVGETWHVDASNRGQHPLDQRAILLQELPARWRRGHLAVDDVQHRTLQLVDDFLELDSLS